MSLYRALGKRIITEEEIESGPIRTKGDYKLEHIPPGDTNPTPFKEIGLGKPMSIWIRHIFVGARAPLRPDLLVTSAIKSVQTFNEAPHAVNFVAENIGKNKHISNVPATDKGTPIVFYTPSLIEENMVITFELKLDILKDYLTTISNAFKSLAGIPIFSAESAGLSAGFTAAGIATGILKKILDIIFKGMTLLKVTAPLNFKLAGSEIPEAGFYLLTEKEISEDIIKNYYVDSKGSLVKRDNTNEVFEGEFPYIIISIDGCEYDSFKDFIPTAASSVLLEKFFKSKEKDRFDFSNEIVQAVTLYSDMFYKDKAIDVKKKRDSCIKDSPEWKKRDEELKAYIKNILNEEIKELVNKQIN
jgi:hypothetical protein